MKKQEYIEKYGEEKYKEYRKWHNEYTNKWRKENGKKYKRKTKTEYIEEHGEEAYLKYREAKQKRNRLWAKANPEKVKNSARKYYLKNAEVICAKSKKWKEENKEYVVARDNNYNKTKRGRAALLNKGYKRADKRRGFDISNNVSSKWIVDNILSGQKCVYCGDQDWTHLGCDRIDNSKPHTEDNIVCSCGLCNLDRADRYTVEEFKKYRSLHPRECDIPKAPAIQLSETGALKKRVIQSR